MRRSIKAKWRATTTSSIVCSFSKGTSLTLFTPVGAESVNLGMEHCLNDALRADIMASQVKTMDFSDLEDALQEYGKKFKDKSGLAWEDRGEEPKNGKYIFLEKSYDDEDDDAANSVKKEDDEDSKEDVASKLPVQTQRLMELIFNENQYEPPTRSDRASLTSL